MRKLIVPLSDSLIKNITNGDRLQLTGFIYTGRDVVLPKLVALIENNGLEEAGIDLKGAVIFHTAVSPAGVGPTSSNKHDIESTIPALSKAGVKIHLGKGRLSPVTIQALHDHHSIYAVVPPVSALLESKILERRVVAFHEEGMEALHMLRVDGFPCIVAAAHGRSIGAFDKE